MSANSGLPADKAATAEKEKVSSAAADMSPAMIPLPIDEEIEASIKNGLNEENSVSQADDSGLDVDGQSKPKAFSKKDVKVTNMPSGAGVFFADPKSIGFNSAMQNILSSAIDIQNFIDAKMDQSETEEDASSLSSQQPGAYKDKKSEIKEDSQ